MTCIRFLHYWPFVRGIQQSSVARIPSHMHPGNERRRYNVTSSLIGRAHIQNDPCKRSVLRMWIFSWWFLCCQLKQAVRDLRSLTFVHETPLLCDLQLFALWCPRMQILNHDVVIWYFNVTYNFPLSDSLYLLFVLWNWKEPPFEIWISLYVPTRFLLLSRDPTLKSEGSMVNTNECRPGCHPNKTFVM